MNKKGLTMIPEMVRIGAFDYEPPKNVKEHTLDYLIDRQVKKSGKYVDHEKIKVYTNKLDKIDDDIYKLEKQKVKLNLTSKYTEC
jgi:hypothetical protein